MLQLLLDTIPTRVFWKDRNSVYLGCNSLFAKDAGFASSDDIPGKTDYDMPWKEQADLYRNDDRNVMGAGTSKLGYEEPETVADGRTVLLRTSKVPLKDENGQIVGVMGIYEDITDHRNAEDQLRERELLYHTIFQRSPFSVALNNLSGQFVDVNEKFVQIVGVPRDEAIGSKPVELGIMEATAQTEILEEIGRSGGQLDGYEFSVTTRQGETKCVQVSSALVTMRDEPLILSIINDITDRRLAEQSLRRSEEKYRELVQNASSIILRWDRDGVIRFFNEFAQTFFGFTQEEVIGQNVMGTIVPKTETSGRDLEIMITEIREHPEYHGTNVNENVRKSGERVWIAWTNKPVLDEHGNIIEILSVGLDITSRIQNQQALQESESRYRSIFNSNVDAFLLLDTEGSIVDANDRAAELYGYTRNELLGKSIKDIADAGFHEAFRRSARMEVGEWSSRETIHIRSDGSRFDAEVHGARLHYGGNERLLEVIFDVTERNRARESMQLFANVAHNMQVGLYIYRLENLDDDRTFKLMAANPASTTELGISESDAVGKYIDDIFPVLREHGIPERLADVVRTGEPFSVVDCEYFSVGAQVKHYSFRAFCLPGNQVGVLLEDITDVFQAQEDKRGFYRKTIEAATEGKLIVCEPGDIEELAGPAIASFEVSRPEEVSAVRQSVAALAEAEGMEESQVFDLTLCTGEAVTNAIKHANRGEVSVHRVDGALLVAVVDEGQGIREINLPDVALKRGYTTAMSLGMGYKAMLTIADQVYLATGPDGTRVAMKLRLRPVERPQSVTSLPETWDD